MASGHRFNPHSHVCAMRSVPFGTRVKIVAANGRTSWCIVEDRGPFYGGRVLDVSPLVRDSLNMYEPGVIYVRVYDLGLAHKRRH
jgi:rare lipoprotein A